MSRGTAISSSCEAAAHLALVATCCMLSVRSRRPQKRTPCMCTSGRLRAPHQGSPEAEAAVAAATPSVTVASVSHSSRSQCGFSVPGAGSVNRGSPACIWWVPECGLASRFLWHGCIGSLALFKRYTAPPQAAVPTPSQCTQPQQAAAPHPPSGCTAAASPQKPPARCTGSSPAAAAGCLQHGDRAMG